MNENNKDAPLVSNNSAIQALARLDKTYYAVWRKDSDKRGSVAGNIHTDDLVAVIEAFRAGQAAPQAIVDLVNEQETFEAWWADRKIQDNMKCAFYMVWQARGAVSTDHYAQLERKHLGDIDKKTGIYATPPVSKATEPEIAFTDASGIKWPVGYSLDPNGKMSCPAGAYEHWLFGYNCGWKEALVARLSAGKADTGEAIRNAALEEAILTCAEWGDRGDAYDCVRSIRALKYATPSTIKADHINDAVEMVPAIKAEPTGEQS